MHDLALIAASTRTLMEGLGREHLGRPLQDLGWTFRFDAARRRLGLCLWEKGGRSVKTISLSRHLAVREGWALMEDVARHEVAHALDFETRGRSAHAAGWDWRPDPLRMVATSGEEIPVIAWVRRAGPKPVASEVAGWRSARVLARALLGRAPPAVPLPPPPDFTMNPAPDALG